MVNIKLQHKLSYFCVLVLLSILFLYKYYEADLFHILSQYHLVIKDWITSHYSLAIMLYILSFIVLISFTIPCATLLCLIGGILFGPSAFFYAGFSIICGGTLLFFAAKHLLTDLYAEKLSHYLMRTNLNFQEHAFYYLLTFRLMPIFPCWLSNVGAGIAQVPFHTFIFASLLGIIPSTFIYVIIGHSMGDILIREQQGLFDVICAPTVFFPLLGLALLSLIAVLYKQYYSK